MNRSALGLAIVLMVMNVATLALLSIGKSTAETFAKQTPLFLFFLFCVISFCAICYLAWYVFALSAKKYDPIYLGMIGVLLPTCTAFIATANWHIFSIVSTLATETRHASGFNDLSLTMIFILFFTGTVTWGLLARNVYKDEVVTEEGPKDEDDQTQNQLLIANGYLVFSYWLAFVMFCWMWLFLKVG